MVDIYSTEEEVLEAVMKNGYDLELVSKVFKNNRQIVEAAIDSRPLALEYASDTLRKDPELVLKAVKKNGAALQFAPALKNNPKIVRAAIEQYPYALQFASKNFQKNEEMVLLAVKKDGCAIRFACQAFRKNKKIVSAAVNQKSENIQFASFDLRNDKEILLDSIKESDYTLRFASKELNREIENCMIENRWTAKQALKHLIATEKRHRYYIAGATWALCSSANLNTSIPRLPSRLSYVVSSFLSKGDEVIMAGSSREVNESAKRTQNAFFSKEKKEAQTSFDLIKFIDKCQK